MNEYLMPANSKKSGLILGLFTVMDLIILGTGVGISAVLLLIFKSSGLLQLIIAVIPGVTSVLLVFPVPNYHNVIQLLINIFKYFTGRRKYEWKGWMNSNEKR